METMVGQQFGKYDTPMSEVIHPEIDNTSQSNQTFIIQKSIRLCNLVSDFRKN